MKENHQLYKIGGITAILGAIGNTVGNILHPATLPSQTGQARLLEIAESNLWYPTHIIIALSVICFAITFLALYHYLLEKGANKAFAQIGTLFAALGTAVSFVLLTIDGFTIKRSADLWHTAAPQTQTLFFHLAAMLEQIDLDLFSMFLLVYFGLAFIFLGLAAWKSKLPRSPWHLIPAVSGLILTFVALYQLVFTAHIWTISVWIPVWTIQSLWMGIMGYMMVRHT